MNTINASFGPALLRIARITYECDLSHVGGTSIPLGIFADVSGGDMYALGLVARSHLGKEELGKIGRLIRSDLRKPFDYLRPIFDRVFDSEDPPKAFAEVIQTHTHSLNFATSQGTSIKVPAAIASNADAFALWSEDLVRRECNDAYWQLFESEMPATIEKSRKDKARLLPHAA